MRRGRSAALAIFLIATVAMSIAGTVESMPETITTPDIVGAGLIVAVFGGMAGLGILIVARTGNRIGWLFCGAGLLFAYQFWTYTRGPGPTEEWLGNSVLYFVMVVTIPTIILLFPDGGLPSRRWWPVPWIGIAAVTLGILYSLFAPTIWGTDRPAPLAGVLPGPAFRALDVLTTVLMISFLIASIASPIVRYRTADISRRLQLKMFGFGAAIALAGTLFLNFGPLDGIDPVIPGVISLLALPVSMTAAIMRYRLYDIDRLISRTVGYTLVVALLALVYMTVAVWLPTRLIRAQPPLFVAGATLAAAALFDPARRRIITWVDRRFNRTRYDAEHVIAEFVERLKDEIDGERVAAHSISTIATTMQPSAIGVWIRQ